LFYYGIAQLEQIKRQLTLTRQSLRPGEM
jgi:hypothetical protein